MTGRARRLAVITGGHPFQVPEFHGLIRAACGEAFTPFVQHLEDFSTSPSEVRSSYAAALFYFFPQGSPLRDGPGGDPGGAIEALLDQGQGCVVLHHALLAYPDWPTWDEVVGCAGRGRFSYHPGIRYDVSVVKDHPLAADLDGWEMTDETYCMPEPAGTPLLTTRDPRSTGVIGWTRSCRASRVACLQPGHDEGAWGNAGFRALLARMLRWAAPATTYDGRLTPSASAT